MMDVDFILKYVEDRLLMETKAKRSNEYLNMVLNRNIDYVDDEVCFDAVEKYVDDITKELERFNSKKFFVHNPRVIDSPLQSGVKRLQLTILFDDNRPQYIKDMNKELHDISWLIDGLLIDDDWNELTIGKIKKRDMYDVLLKIKDKLGGRYL